MSDLEPRTPCYLVNLVEMTELLGRVVEIERGPVSLADEPGSWYYVTAPWVHEMFDGRELIAPRHHLSPIAPRRLAPHRHLSTLET